ncbi:hypothetical protein FB45DRAFT_1042840 [Roridomyces roridus]|uniref:Ribonuclease H1 N-terminal domain-containing protein n=1 Tax=Roridomyces roridus TaxID=1738132 RepID=A0AAD7AYY9_9AGAR|nr:hypothetical protein FB45DRAFT_1042840 [Roridomyces roridus]
MPRVLVDPADEIDDLLAALVLFDLATAPLIAVVNSRPRPTAAPIPSPPSTPQRHASSAFPAPSTPPPYSAIGIAITDTDTRTPPAYRNRTLYEYTADAESPLRRTPDWSQAASAAQAGNGGSARALHPRNRRRSKPSVYVVFRGRHVGLMYTWAEVSQVIVHFRFALYQGYHSSSVAAATFQYAQAHGWVSTHDDPTAVRPVPREALPLPMATSATATPPATLSPREARDPWYVVYNGIHPGIFPNYLECALNVLGVDRNFFEHLDTFAEAQAKFAAAQQRGEVVSR